MKEEGVLLDLGEGWLTAYPRDRLLVWVSPTKARGWWAQRGEVVSRLERMGWDALGRTGDYALPEAAKALIRAVQEELRRQE